MTSDRTLTDLRAGRLAGARRLDLSCGLDAVPDEVFTLADTLEVLNLTGNALATLPDHLPRLHRLKVLFCSDNRFTELPAVLGRCPSLTTIGFKANRIAHVPDAALAPQLRWLILTDNAIASLPDGLGRCTRLQKLMLAGNRLHGLPASMAGCTGIELLRLSANRFEALPAWLRELPRLAWLAIGGNPWSAAREAEATAVSPLPHVAWSSLRLEAVLGEGASGVIHRATWQAAPGDARAVAVKLFKGAVTSDGWPATEMATCLAAQPHAGLVGVRGRLSGHPAGRQGLVMELVDPAFRVLAGPPSLDSCTRDVYDPGLRFTPASASALARQVASSVRHLHRRGLMHGDLYAHNLLWDGATEARLGDFGAASWLPDGWAEAGRRMESRAFGCLLEELVSRCDGDAGVLPAWRDRCLAADPSSRPDFETLADGLG